MNNIDIIKKINTILKENKNSQINIINDKFTLSVFRELHKNLKNIKEINFIIRSNRDQGSRDVEKQIKDIIFNDYDEKEKNKLEHFYYAKLMYQFITDKVNVKIINHEVVVRGNLLTINRELTV